MLMKLNDPNINSATFTNLQCGTRYNFTVVVNTTTFINESNTASIHLAYTPSTTPYTTPRPAVGKRSPPSEPVIYSASYDFC